MKCRSVERKRLLIYCIAKTMLSVMFDPATCRHISILCQGYLCLSAERLGRGLGRDLRLSPDMLKMTDTMYG